jgi:hypothetical protein
MLCVSTCVFATTVLSDRFLQNLVLRLSNRGHANACFKLRTMRNKKMADALRARRSDGQNVAFKCSCTVAHIRFVSGLLSFEMCNCLLSYFLLSFVVVIHYPFFVLDVLILPSDRQKYVYLSVRLRFVLYSFLIRSVFVRIGKILF